MSGYMLSTPRKRMNAITFPEEKSSVRSNRDRMLETNNIRLISADGMDWLFTLNAALSDGEIVSIHADRLFGSSKALTVNILGAEAKIPMGPFNLAASRGLPVTASFCMKTGYKSYEAIQYRLDTPEMETMSKREKMDYLAARYAAAVNEILGKWPLQWYNFFEFWD
jgi:predicted LPLAT superfamily acyltransferase